jgi:hypothetical protein
MIKNKDTVNLVGLMVAVIKDNGKMENKMAVALIEIKKDYRKMVHGSMVKR